MVGQFRLCRCTNGVSLILGVFVSLPFLKFAAHVKLTALKTTTL